jgi:hypothetical protein
MQFKQGILAVTLTLITTGLSLFAQSEKTLVVRAAQIKAEVQPVMWGFLLNPFLLARLSWYIPHILHS